MENYWGEIDWHANGLPTREELRASNRLLALTFPLKLDVTVPPGTAELRDGDCVRARLVGLADSD